MTLATAETLPSTARFGELEIRPDVALGDYKGLDVEKLVVRVESRIDVLEGRHHRLRHVRVRG